MNSSNYNTELPLTTANLTLKFSRPTFSNKMGEVVMTSAFPGFKSDPNFDKEAERKKMMATGLYTEVIIPDDGVPIRRRFAGDYTLSRGRYFSVCNDELGNDRGTVTRELLGYYEGNAGHLMIHDLIMPDHKELLQKHCPNSPAGYLIELYSTSERPSPIAVKLMNEGLLTTESGELPETMGIFMPMDIKTETIENIFDLRQMKTQQWLASFLPKGDEYFSKDADPIASFVEILPDLTVYDRGGSDFTEKFGNFLRHNGANGMIFPSARCDIGCEFLNGELNDYRGFNYVDYRGLKPPVASVVRDVSPWTNKIFEGITIHTAPDDTPYAHSWRMEGKEAGEDSNRELWMNKFHEKQE